MGIAGQISVAYERLFEDMLVVDSVRGIDGVGVAAVDTIGGVSVFKRAMFPHDYIFSAGWQGIRKKVNRVLIGHNRWATAGKINNLTAHPFEFDSVVGAHNGTLRRQNLLPDSRDFSIDSENIFHSIDVQGVEETYKNIDGAAALVYYDKKKRTLNFLRNKDRPFFFTYSKDRKTLFWASEDWMLYGLLAKHKIEHTKVVATSIDHHYALPLEGLKANEPLDKMHIRKLTPYEAPVYSHKGFNYHQQHKPTVVSRKGNVISESIKKSCPIGKTIKFLYKRGHVPLGSQWVDGSLASEDSVVIRLFVNSTYSDLNDKLGKGIKYEFLGKVNGYDSEGRVLVQSNSVTAIVRTEERKVIDIKPKRDDKQKMLDSYIAFGDTMLNKEEFDALPESAKTCCWCTQDVRFEEGNIILNKRDAVCKDCADQEMVQEYLETLGEC